MKTRKLAAMRAKRIFAFLFLLAVAASAAEKMTAPELIALAARDPGRLTEAIRASFEARRLAEGAAWAGRGETFFFAVENASRPQLSIDGVPGPEMRRAAGNLWYAVAEIRPAGTAHAFHYLVNGAIFGGSYDVPVFGPLSYQRPGVPSGTLSERITHTSSIYDGMKSVYQIYVPAQYDPKTPAALMVFQDGAGYLNREGANPALNVIDNLIAEKKIPVMICVFVNPGDISGAPGTPTYNFVKNYAEKWGRTLGDSMRSTLYDTVSDRYARYLRDEILAEVGAKYNLRHDAYSRAISGASSGGICSFNAAWQMPGEFSRVLSWIGSFVSIQWKEDPAVADGGQDFPEKILREPKRNIRVWLQDGARDMEGNWFERHYGAWPTANIAMANALKLAGYDFHFSFGGGTHSGAQGAAEFPESMIWLWRDYDPAKTEQVYEMEPAEKPRPPFRAVIGNRETK
jgi:enterochelin esterase family protein